MPFSNIQPVAAAMRIPLRHQITTNRALYHPRGNPAALTACDSGRGQPHVSVLRRLRNIAVRGKLPAVRPYRDAAIVRSVAASGGGHG
jgi:hypothetical protein